MKERDPRALELLSLQPTQPLPDLDTYTDENLVWEFDFGKSSQVALTEEESKEIHQQQRRELIIDFGDASWEADCKKYKSGGMRYVEDPMNWSNLFDTEQKKSVLHFIESKYH